MALSTQQATTELFNNNYNVWKAANPPVNASNAPAGCSEISQETANTIRTQWLQGTAVGAAPGPNNWGLTAATGVSVNDPSGTAIVRWVSRSVSGGGTVVDFHALWGQYTFLRHFKVV